MSYERAQCLRKEQVAVTTQKAAAVVLLNILNDSPYDPRKCNILTPAFTQHSHFGGPNSHRSLASERGEISKVLQKKPSRTVLREQRSAESMLSSKQYERIGTTR